MGPAPEFAPGGNSPFFPSVGRGIPPYPLPRPVRMHEERVEWIFEVKRIPILFSFGQADRRRERTAKSDRRHFHGEKKEEKTFALDFIFPFRLCIQSSISHESCVGLWLSWSSLTYKLRVSLEQSRRKRRPNSIIQSNLVCMTLRGGFYYSVSA